MEYLVNAREMKACDEQTSKTYGMPPVVLMERAAEAVADEVKARIKKSATILVLCGGGNNGGDGYATARLLFLLGYTVSIFPLVKPAKDSLCEKERKICQNYQIKECDHLPEEPADVVIDAIFGTGLSRDLEAPVSDVLKTVNEWPSYRIAVDIPSGVSADHGRILGTGYKADLTVTFAYKKLGQVLFPGAAYCGETVCHDIGITDHAFEGRLPRVCTLTEEDLSSFPDRKADTHKGDYGKVLVIAGSSSMCGAAAFAAEAAFRMGAGLVKIFTAEENKSALQTLVPEALLSVYRNDKFDEKALVEDIHWADVCLIGPGLSTTATAQKILKTTLQSVSVPLIIDADGINLLAKEPEILKGPHTDVILTPHIGEMSRLTGDSPMYLKEERLRIAEEFANEYNVILTLKDSRTVTAIPYGKLYLNTSGNHGMATGGSGDVLSGMIAGLLAVGAKAELAASLSVYLHGLAGDLAAKDVSAASLMARDLLRMIPTVLKKTEEQKSICRP